MYKLTVFLLLLASYNLFSRALVALSVHRPFMNPNCFLESPLVPSSIYVYMWFTRSDSKIFPISSRSYNGLYEDGSPSGLPSFGIRASHAHFQHDGKIPALRQLLKMFVSVIGLISLYVPHTRNVIRSLCLSSDLELIKSCVHLTLGKGR